MALSCLTTAAAIISMAGDMFSEMSGGKLKYRPIVIGATIAGFVLVLALGIFLPMWSMVDIAG
jgi:LIVCS family branched-chain amino acid:cation transporter